MRERTILRSEVCQCYHCFALSISKKTKKTVDKYKIKTQIYDTSLNLRIMKTIEVVFFINFHDTCNL